jgi:hypothetical protein
MSQIVASQSLAAGAVYTSAAYAFDIADVVVASVANSSTAPNVQTVCQLQLSIDGVNWIGVDRRIFGLAPSLTYYEAFPLMAFAGGNPVSSGAGYQNPLNWIQYRLVFTSNSQTNAVTIAAVGSLGVTETMAVVPIIATTVFTGGAQGTWQPPELTAVIITRVIVYIATATTGACTLAIGTGTSATTSYSNLVPATTIHTSGAIVDNILSNIVAATAAESGCVGTAVLLPAASYVTFTGSASSAGVVGAVYIKYIKP